MEKKHSEEASMSLGWYVRRVDELEKEVEELNKKVQHFQAMPNTPTKKMGVDKCQEE